MSFVATSEQPSTHARTGRDTKRTGWERVPDAVISRPTFVESNLYSKNPSQVQHASFCKTGGAAQELLQSRLQAGVTLFLQLFRVYILYVVKRICTTLILNMVVVPYFFMSPTGVQQGARIGRKGRVDDQLGRLVRSPRTRVEMNEEKD